MAERPDPDTDPNTLADRLWATTDMMYDHEAMVDDVTAGDLRAAADGLRQLAAITAAIGEHRRQHTDVDGEPVWPCCTDDEALWVAASLSPTPTPQHCPTCGSSEDPERTMGGHWTCYDPWHDGGQP